MKAAALLSSGLLICAAPAPLVPPPPVEYRGTDPITVTLTLADARWVNAECIKRVGREPGPGQVFEACAGVGSGWMILRHGSLYPGDGMGEVVAHETGHVRGWFHG